MTKCTVKCLKQFCKIFFNTNCNQEINYPSWQNLTIVNIECFQHLNIEFDQMYSLGNFVNKPILHQTFFTFYIASLAPLGVGVILWQNTLAKTINVTEDLD